MRSKAEGDLPFAINRENGIATLTLLREERRNPLSPELLDHIFDALDDLESDPDIRAIILTGSGPVFCAGAEMGTVLHPDGMDGETQFLLLRRFFRLAQRIREIDLPVIAAVNGPAVGGGASLALACDFAIASRKASCYFAFGRVGAAGCDMGCSFFLPRIVGAARARLWLLTGATVDADEGLAAGMFVEICSEERLLPRARELALKIAASSPRRATAATKFAIARGEEIDLNSCISYEAYIQGFMFTLPEHRSRLGEFLNTRKKKNVP